MFFIAKLSQIKPNSRNFSITRMQPQIKNIAIEGNIAAGRSNIVVNSLIQGKSSFLKVLESMNAEVQDFHYAVVPEPITNWQQVNGDSKSKDDHHGVRCTYHSMWNCYRIFCLNQQ